MTLQYDGYAHMSIVKLRNFGLDIHAYWLILEKYGGSESDFSAPEESRHQSARIG
jgi:hypothetical protein